MTNIRVKEKLSLLVVTMDWLIRDTGFIDEREEFPSSVRVALGTDMLADADEVLPDPDSTDRRGWWGDLDAEIIWEGWPIGCRNWLLSRAKISDALSEEGNTVERAQRYTVEALQPFLDRRMASDMNVVATRTDIQTIEVDATLFRGPELEIDLRYQFLWDEVVKAPAIDPIKPPAPIGRRNVRANLTLTTTKPTVGHTGLRNITPTTRQMVMSKYVPSVRRDIKYIGTRQMVMTTTAPTVQLKIVKRNLSPPSRNLTLQRWPVTVHKTP